MKPYLHARSSVKKYGGKTEDYQDIHDFMDSTKSAVADVRHRIVLHSAFGCFIVEKVFGITRKNSEGKEYSVRDVAEDHVLEDLGFIPSLEKWLEGLPVAEWMGGPSKKKTTIPFVETTQEDLAKKLEEYVKKQNEASKTPAPYIPPVPYPNPMPALPPHLQGFHTVD